MASIITGAVTVTSAGTAVQFSTAQDAIRSIRIRVTSGNAGSVYFGASNVDSTNSPPLAGGEELLITWPDNKPGMLSDLYLDAGTSNDSARYWAVPV